MPKVTVHTGATNGSQVVSRPDEQLNDNAVVVKVQVGGVYVWPGGISPDGFAVIHFIGSSDPASTSGGRDSDNDIWFDTS